MQKNTLQPKITNIYDENGLTLTELMQEWLNENYFFGNLNNDKNEIKYNGINSYRKFKL